MVKICLLITSTWKAGCASEDGEKSLRKCKQAVTRVHVRFIFLMCYWLEHLIQNKHYLVYKIQSLLPPLASVRIWKEASLWKQQCYSRRTAAGTAAGGGKRPGAYFSSLPYLFPILLPGLRKVSGKKLLVLSHLNALSPHVPCWMVPPRLPFQNVFLSACAHSHLAGEQGRVGFIGWQWAFTLVWSWTGSS